MQRSVSPFCLALAIVFLAVYLLATAARSQAPPVAPDCPAGIPAESPNSAPPAKPAPLSAGAQRLVGTWKLNPNWEGGDQRRRFTLSGDKLTLPGAEPEEKPFVNLFAEDGVPQGWLVRQWNDLSKPAEPGVTWTVREGILHGSTQRGTWLTSEQQYGDFVLEFEFKLGPHGNSGCALRAPPAGDPAFEGMEMQMADLRYNPQAKDSELTGGIYRAIAPRKQVYKPTEWNKYTITLKGSHLHAVFNGEVIHDLNLDEQDQQVKRHDGSLAPPVKSRPRRGHIGFQELSRSGDHVQIRNVRLKTLD